jgi:hypothetical protein
LSYLAASVHDPGTLVMPGDPLRFGSLSGLVLDAATGQWVGAMDDTQRPRLVWLDLAGGANGLSVRPDRYTYLRAVPGVTPPGTLEALDMESLVVRPDGTFAATNEGHLDRNGTPRQPMVIRIARDGGVLDVVVPRAHFTMPVADRTRGVRHNLGLESLTRTPDGRLISGLEQPLAQDGPMSSPARGGRVRLVEFVPEGERYRPGREWAYDLDATPRRIGYTTVCQDGENGLSELYALDDHRFIALERACLFGAVGRPAFNPVRLHLVDVEGADDVSAHASIAGLDVRPVRKRLLLDLTTLTPRVGPELQRWSNFEGIAAGPPAPDGSPTLVLVSDDNFRASQTLAFVWLKLVNGTVTETIPGRATLATSQSLRRRELSP